MREDFGSRRIDIGCPACKNKFKVRIGKLQFRALLDCRLCRHEFDAAAVASLPEVRIAMAKVKKLEALRDRY
jgi:ribosomal protein L37AE/L43A